jgi:hypothetical protein
LNLSGEISLLTKPMSELELVTELKPSNTFPALQRAGVTRNVGMSKGRVYLNCIGGLQCGCQILNVGHL